MIFSLTENNSLTENTEFYRLRLKDFWFTETPWLRWRAMRNLYCPQISQIFIAARQVFLPQITQILQIFYSHYTIRSFALQKSLCGFTQILSLRDGFLDVLEELGRCAAIDFVILVFRQNATKTNFLFLHTPRYVCDVSWRKNDRPFGIKKMRRNA